MLRHVLACLFVAALAQAAVTRVEITERADVPVDNYERIAGKVYFTVDPKLEANRGIVDIDLAPKNAAGLVEFSADLLVLRPKDPAKGNGTAFLEIANRGTPAAWTAINVGAARGMRTEKDFGDRFMLDQGFTMVWVGWQFDVTEAQNIKLYAPVIKGLTGPVRSEILVNQKSTSQALPYAVAEGTTGTLTVRDKAEGQRTTVAKDQWRLNGDRIEMASGFEPGRLYDFVYTGKDPAVAGLGMAAVRDYVSYMKKQGEVKRAIGMGISQSGRFLRTFIWNGFNSDEQDHKVFDAIWAHVAGAGNGDFNQRFAQPSRTSGQFGGVDFPTDLPPHVLDFWGDYGGNFLLGNSIEKNAIPKVFLTNGSHEYWGRAASLTHTLLASDFKTQKDTRIYYVAGTQHGTGGSDMKGLAQNRSNPMEWAYFMHSTAVNLNAWITNGTEPPATQVPLASKKELIAPSALKFPKIPNINVVTKAYTPRELDFGPEFLSKGVETIEPPKVGQAQLVMVPQVNRDGNETSGIRLPELQVPLATYTGWNLRDPKIGGPTEQYSLTGSFIPFPRTKAERQKTGDPRLSIEERYKDEQEYMTKIEAAAKELVKSRFLLEADVPQVLAHAKRTWDSLMGPAAR